MISGHDLYTVLSAVVPLYVAMILAYGSVRWWKVLTPDQCGGINRFVAIFAVPLLSFEILASNNPYKMNVHFIAADVLQKLLILLMLGIWARFSRKGSMEWLITLFMLATLPNTLVMGIPLLAAMYGNESGGLVVQAVVLQCIIWYTLLLFLYEYRSAKKLILEQFPKTAASIVSVRVESDVMSLDGERDPIQTDAEIGEDGKIHVTVRKSTSSRHSVLSPRRSIGLGSMPSSKALTPRPSNLTGAEIYSLQSSRNLTPRESSFNHSDFYSVMMSSATTTTGAAAGAAPATAAAAAAVPYKQHHLMRPSSARGKVEDENTGKDLHMFVWSSSGSPMSSSEQQTNHHHHHHHHHPAAGGRHGNESEEFHDDRDDFSFGNRPSFHGEESMNNNSSTRHLQVKSFIEEDEDNSKAEVQMKMPAMSVMTKLILDMVWRKLIRNPNTYSSLLGLGWALVSFKWHVKMPSILDNSIHILSNAGLGMAMFSLGLFMALQKRILVCGTWMAIFGMVARFLSGPAVMAATSIAVGLRGVDLHVSIVQAALPQGIVPFVFAKEYNVHPDILSTAVIFGMLVAFPITMLYYLLLGL